MKKLFSSLFILILLIAVFWGIAGWYFGANAHQELKAYLKQADSIPGEKLFRAELIDFKKTLLGAKARLRVHSDTVFLNEALGTIDLKAKILNGPVFIDKKSFTTQQGATRWQLSIDQSALNQSQADMLHTFFPVELPTATVVIDFDNTAHYTIVLNSYLAKAIITGQYDLNSAENSGDVNLTDLHFKIDSFDFASTNSSIHYQHQKNITAAFKPGTTNIDIPELLLSHPKLEKALNLKVTADIAVQTSQRQKQDFLNSLLKMTISQKVNGNKKPDKYLPIEEANLRLQIDNLSIQGLIDVSETRADLDNIRQQIQWTIEDGGELPEGQDRIWVLNDTLDELQKSFPQLVTQKLFSSTAKHKQTAKNKDNDDSLQGVKLSISAQNNSQTKKKPSTLKANIGIQNLGLAPSHSINLMAYLKGHAKLDLADDLFQYVKQKLPVEHQSLFPKAKLNLQIESGEIVVKP